jgi:hypothetical protein
MTLFGQKQGDIDAINTPPAERERMEITAASDMRDEALLNNAQAQWEREEQQGFKKRFELAESGISFLSIGLWIESLGSRSSGPYDGFCSCFC